MKGERLLPERFRRLSGSGLKLIALITMLIDHTTLYFVNKDAVMFCIAGHSYTWFGFLRSVGRLAFPLYCFLLIEGYVHTRDRKKYAIRLGAFALISEIPWNLLHSGNLLSFNSQNVFFTLFLGYLAVWAFDSFRGDKKRQTASLFCLTLMSLILRADYGMTGFGFIVMMYILREEELIRAIIGSCFLSGKWRAGLAFVPIAMYNGERGFIRSKWLQYAFYAIYPLHMLAFYLIKTYI